MVAEVGGPRRDMTTHPRTSEGLHELPAGLIEGDALAVLRALPSNTVDLIYIDPPFGTGQVRRLQSIRTGTGKRLRKGFGDRVYRYEVESTHQYRDDMALEEYLA